MTIGRIYCIRNSVDDSVYVGSTTECLKKRLIKHKYQAKRTPDIQLYLKFLECGFDKFTIELLEEIEYEDKQQLRNLEGEYIKTMGTLNTHITGRTKSEYAKTWREENREHYLQQRKNFNDKHREELNEKRREYYRKKADWDNEPLVCECGRTVTRQHLNHHRKTKIHNTIMSSKMGD